MLKKFTSFLLAMLLSLSLLPGQALASDEPAPPEPPAIVEQVEPETPEEPEEPIMSRAAAGEAPDKGEFPHEID